MEIGNGTAAERAHQSEMARLYEACKTEAGFRSELSAAYAIERAKRDAENEIERRLAAAWFAAHPEEL